MRTVVLILVLVAVGAFAYFQFVKKEGINLFQSTHEIKDADTSQAMTYEVLKEGNGPVAEKGKVVAVHYRGMLKGSDQEFDSSFKRNTPFNFKLGSNVVIKGWEMGIEGMKVGEKRKIHIPPELGYGAQGIGSVIPPNSHLDFEVELMEVRDPVKF